MPEELSCDCLFDLHTVSEMKLDLSEIATHLGKRIGYKIDEPPIVDIESGIKCRAPITGEVTFTNSGRHIVARGSFSATLEMDCARCLAAFLVDLDLPIEEELPILPELIEEDEEELPEDEKEPLFVDNILDLTELLRQSIVVAVPIKPLCSQECKGLCPLCGTNLNERQCECSTQDVNPLFASLGSLLKEE